MNKSDYQATLSLPRAVAIESNPPRPTLADSVWLRVILSLMIAVLIGLCVVLGKLSFDVDRLYDRVDKLGSQIVTPGELRKLP